VLTEAASVPSAFVDDDVEPDDEELPLLELPPDDDPPDEVDPPEVAAAADVLNVKTLEAPMLASWSV
jgi:hypothetical protein